MSTNKKTTGQGNGKNGKNKGPRPLTAAEEEGVKKVQLQVEVDTRPAFILGRYWQIWSRRQWVATQSDSVYPHAELRADAHDYLTRTLVYKGEIHEKTLRSRRKDKSSSTFSYTLERLMSALRLEELPRRFSVADLVAFAEGVNAEQILARTRSREKRAKDAAKAESRD
jgi:hypothetical protein